MEFFVLKSCVQAHLPVCSQFYFLSDEYILYMKSWINTGVDQTELLSAVSVPFSHIVTQQSNKEILENLMNISRLSKNHEDVSKLFC